PDRPDREAAEVAGVAGGAMVAIAGGGSGALWAAGPLAMGARLDPAREWAEPLAMRAVLIPARSGVAVLFADGTYEATGDAEEAIRCQQGETIAPLAACGDARAAAGAL